MFAFIPLPVRRRRGGAPAGGAGFLVATLGLVLLIWGAIRIAFMGGGWDWFVGVGIGLALFVAGLRMLIAKLK